MASGPIWISTGSMAGNGRERSMTSGQLVRGAPRDAASRYRERMRAGKGSTASHAAAMAVAGRGSDIVPGQRIHRDRERSIRRTENRLFDDMARVASGALSGFTGLKQEIEARIREQVERLLRDMDLVTR